MSISLQRCAMAAAMAGRKRTLILTTLSVTQIQTARLTKQPIAKKPDTSSSYCSLDVTKESVS